jgi:hypothetical protein
LPPRGLLTLALTTSRTCAVAARNAGDKAADQPIGKNGQDGPDNQRFPRVKPATSNELVDHVEDGCEDEHLAHVLPPMSQQVVPLSTSSIVFDLLIA